VADPERTTFSDLGHVGPWSFDVRVVGRNGCLGGADVGDGKDDGGAGLTRRASLPRRAKQIRAHEDTATPPPIGLHSLAAAPTSPQRRMPPAPSAGLPFCEDDFKGSPSSIFDAQQILGTRVEFPYGQKAFAGTVTGYEVSSDFGDRVQHSVLFDDGTSQDYTLEEVLRVAEAFVRVRAGAANPLPSIVLRPAVNTATGAAPVTPETAVTGADSSNPMRLDVPASFGTYPLRTFIDGEWVEGRVKHREVSLEHGHRWRVELIAPREAEGFWISAQELARHLEFSRATLKLNAPARKVSTLVPVQGLPLPHGDR